MIENIVAIDGGGTSTTAVLTNFAGKCTKLSPAAGCNPQDGTDWKRALDSVLRQVPTNSCVVLGMPGYSELPEIDQAIDQHLMALPFKKLEILNDVELALWGAFPHGDGVLLLSGTGSMAMAFDGKNVQRTGGWGHHFGDEGSAHWIGMRALSIASHEIDGRSTNTGFSTRLAQELGASNHHFGLISWVLSGTSKRAKIASCARIVDHLANHGDRVALGILKEAASSLIDLARVCTDRAKMTEPFRWSPSGSVFQSAAILEAVSEQIGSPTPPQVTALCGGLLRGAKLAGWETNIPWEQTLAKNCDDHSYTKKLNVRTSNESNS